MMHSPGHNRGSVSTGALPDIASRRNSAASSFQSPTNRKGSVGSIDNWSSTTPTDALKKNGPIEVKTSPWQLVQPSQNNQCHFLIYSPMEMFDLPEALRAEILRLNGTKAGFVIYADNGKAREKSRSAIVKAFVFIPYNVQAYDTFPLEAEQEIKRHFVPPKYNPTLQAVVRLRQGSLKATPNGVLAMVGSFARLKAELARAVPTPAQTNGTTHVMILPLTVKLYDIVDYVTECLTNLSIDTSNYLMKVGPQLITFSELYTTTNSDLTHVLITATLHVDPAGPSDLGQFVLVDFPGSTGSRQLGESTMGCVGRKLLEDTGIAYELRDEDGVMNMLSMDRTVLTMVEELLGDHTASDPASAQASGTAVDPFKQYQAHLERGSPNHSQTSLTTTSSKGSLPSLSSPAKTSTAVLSSGSSSGKVRRQSLQLLAREHSGGSGGGGGWQGTEYGDSIDRIAGSIETSLGGAGAVAAMVLTMDEYADMVSSANTDDEARDFF